MILELLVEVLIICGIGLYLRSYLKKKGENLATKEDVELITDKVEGVRSEYAERLKKLHRETVYSSNKPSNSMS